LVVTLKYPTVKQSVVPLEVHVLAPVEQATQALLEGP